MELWNELGSNNLAEWNRRFVNLNNQNFSFDGHEYLREIYQAHKNYMVIEKASQMGMSVFALSKAVWACLTRGMKVIYFFPTNDDVKYFSKDRYRKLIDESPDLSGLIACSNKNKNDADNVNFKNLGKGALYFRGLFYSSASRQGRSGVRTKSVDADFLVFDELDEAQPKQKEAAKHRIDHSNWKWVLELSTPTIPDYGIDVEFKRSDQRYWLLKCERCNNWNCVEDYFGGPNHSTKICLKLRCDDWQ